MTSAAAFPFRDADETHRADESISRQYFANVVCKITQSDPAVLSHRDRLADTCMLFPPTYTLTHLVKD